MLTNAETSQILVFQRDVFETDFAILKQCMCSEEIPDTQEYFDMHFGYQEIIYVEPFQSLKLYTHRFAVFILRIDTWIFNF